MAVLARNKIIFTTLQKIKKVNQTPDSVASINVKLENNTLWLH